MKLSLSTVDIFKQIQSDIILKLSDEQLLELQRVLMEIVYDIDDFCTVNHIDYYLGGGSALGAIRHHGFIPWDDDIDLNMRRCDYERFIRLFSEKMGDKYWVHTPEITSGYALQLARIRLKGTSVKTREDFFCDECGAYVDIFIIDNIPNHMFFRMIHGTISLGLGFLLSCRKFYRERKHLKIFLNNNAALNFPYYVKTIIGFFTSVLPLQIWVEWNYRWNGILKNQKTSSTTIPAGRKHYWREILDYSDIFPARHVQFGDRHLPVYHHVEKYLQILYGDDYMKVPTKDHYEKHIMFSPFYLNTEENGRGI